MPNPKKYNSKNKWMKDWMHRRKQEKGKVGKQDIAIGLNMWREKNKKASSALEIVKFAACLDGEGFFEEVDTLMGMLVS